MQRKTFSTQHSVMRCSFKFDNLTRFFLKLLHNVVKGSNGRIGMGIIGTKRIWAKAKARTFPSYKLSFSAAVFWDQHGLYPLLNLL